MIDLDAGQALGEVVDHVVAPELAVRQHVDARRLLVLDRGLDDRVVDLVQVVARQAPGEEVVLRALEPRRHRVAADDGGGEQTCLHRMMVPRQSRWVV